MRVVVFKLNHLGDTVVFLPALQALRAHFPAWRLTVITTPQEKILYENLLPPEELLTSPKLRFDQCWFHPWELAAWSARVRSRQPDACLVGFDQGNVAHLLARYSGAALRVGGTHPRIRVRHSLTHEIPVPASGWVAEWNWDLARALARAAAGVELPATPPPPDLSHLLSAEFDPISHLPSPISAASVAAPGIVVHAGASSEFTRWPIDRFVAVATSLARDHAVTWIDRPETRAAVLPASVRRVEPASLRDFATLLTGARLFLGNNSGPMHVANALGLRGVVVTGSTHRGWDPYWHRERWTVLRHPSLPCQPCEQLQQATAVCTHLAEPFACLRHWSAAAVEAACRESLARSDAPRHG